MQGVRRAIRFLRITSAHECQLENHTPFVQRTGRTQSNGLSVRPACAISDFFAFGSSMPPCLLENGSHVHDYVYKSQVMGMCTQTTLQGGSTVRTTRALGAPQKLYDDIVASMDKKLMPYSHQLQELIRSSSTASEVALAMDAADRLRSFKMLDTGDKDSNHTKEVTHMMVAACLRAGDTQNALKLLWRKNPAGFTSSIGTAHLLLKHAKFHKKVRFMRQVLRAMTANDVHPTRTTADIILRLCKDAGETESLFSLAREYNKAGLTFHETLFDVLISTAANAGDLKSVHEIQNWREKQGLVHTTASAVAMAKVLVLEGKPKEAAVMIKEHCPDGRTDGKASSDLTKKGKRERYLSIMVKVWPLQLLTTLKVESRDKYLRKLKEDVACMFDSLTNLGLTFPTIDVSENFAEGKGSLSAAQKEVMASR